MLHDRSCSETRWPRVRRQGRCPERTRYAHPVRLHSPPCLPAAKVGICAHNGSPKCAERTFQVCPVEERRRHQQRRAAPLRGHMGLKRPMHRPLLHCNPEAFQNPHLCLRPLLPLSGSTLAACFSVCPYACLLPTRSATSHAPLGSVMPRAAARIVCQPQVSWFYSDLFGGVRAGRGLRRTGRTNVADPAAAGGAGRRGDAWQRRGVGGWGGRWRGGAACTRGMPSMHQGYPQHLGLTCC